MTRRIACSVAAVGFGCLVGQIVLLRELLSAFTGNELIVGVILGHWLLLMGLGAQCGRIAFLQRAAAPLLPLLQVAVGLLPPLQTFTVRWARDLVFPRGAAVGLSDVALSVFVLLLPLGLCAGLFLSLASARLAALSGDPPTGRSVGRVYALDGVGSLAGGVVCALALGFGIDHFRILWLATVANLALASVLAFGLGPRLPGLASAALTLAAGVGLGWFDCDTLTLRRQYRPSEVRLHAESAYGRLAVVESAGQLDFYYDGLPMFSTHSPERAEESVHYAMAQRPEARRVLLIGGVFAGAASEVLKHRVEQVVGVELDPMLAQAARRFIPGLAADSRLRIELTDGRRFVQHTTERFDVVVVQMPDPVNAQLNRFYTQEFFREARAILAPRGVLAFALGEYENAVSPELAGILSTAHRTLSAVFPEVRLLPGSRVHFLASDQPLTSDIETALANASIQNRHVRGGYLRGMLTADRLEELARAASVRADPNLDHQPRLFVQVADLWASQFGSHSSLWLALLALVLVASASFFPGVPRAVFAGGLAASATETVLLFGLQVLSGALYRDLALVVAAFMAGLTAGAMLGQRQRDATPAHVVQVSWQLAAACALLPAWLIGVGYLSRHFDLGYLTPALVALASLGLAALVGFQFTAAGRADNETIARRSSRLYTADFLGAAAGGYSVSAVLLPRIGILFTCLVIAGLCALAASTIRRK